jgi:hypothetical protein
MHPVSLRPSGTVDSFLSACNATLALNAAPNFLRDLVTSIAPSVMTEQNASHCNDLYKISAHNVYRHCCAFEGSPKMTVKSEL